MSKCGQSNKYNPEVIGGTPVFNGKRLFIQALFDYIETHETLEEFIENFPTVKKQQSVEVLEIDIKTI